jgi:hypothetical protein
MLALCGRSSAERFPSAEPRLVRGKTLDQFDLKALCAKLSGDTSAN